MVSPNNVLTNGPRPEYSPVIVSIAITSRNAAASFLTPLMLAVLMLPQQIPAFKTLPVHREMVPSQAARHRYLCPGAGIIPVLAASLPEKPSIDAQAGSNPNTTKSSFASMIGSIKRNTSTRAPPSHCVAPARRLQPSQANQKTPRYSEACDPSMCCPRFLSNRSASSDCCGGAGRV